MSSLDVLTVIDSIDVAQHYFLRMPFKDFCANFSSVEACMLSPDSSGDMQKKTWSAIVHQGSWKRDVSAGGCINNRTTFHINPQYK